MWSDLDRNAKGGIIGGGIILLLLTVFMMYWLFSDKQVVLFSNMDEKEAANIVTALEDMKVPYSLKDNGRAVLVDESQSQVVRVKLLGQGVPVNSGSGFELFDNADIGMTEYSQKINYLRAMQGELARSIMAIEGVKFARVHLVLPETSLFRQKGRSPSASVTIVPDQNRTLQNDQILGIQRMVAAAAPGLEQDQVTVIDNRGITLSTVNPENSKENVTTLILQKKQEAESYLERKVNAILEKTFGDRKATATISVDIAVDKVHRKEEVVLPNSSQNQGVLRKRESTSASTQKNTSAPKTVELEYEVGRRIEEVISMPGAITRISVGVMVPDDIGQDQIDHLKNIVSMSVGLDFSRGDAIEIYPFREIEPVQMGPVNPTYESTSGVQQQDSAPTQAKGVQAFIDQFEEHLTYILGGMLAAIVVLLFALIMSMRRRRPQGMADLTSEERNRLLSDIQTWLEAGDGVKDGV